MMTKMTFYRLGEDATLPSSEKLDELLATDGAFKPCEPTDLSRSGFIPVGPTDMHCYNMDNGHFQILEFQTESKVIPAQEIKKLTQERITATQFKIGKKLNKDEKDLIKLTATKELAALAFTRKSSVKVALFNNLKADGTRLIGVESGKNKAEEVISALRKVLGSLPTSPFKPDDAVNQMVNCALGGTEHSLFEFDGNCTLTNLADESEIRFKQRTSDEVNEHIAGHRVSAIGLTNRDISFEVNEVNPLALTKIKYKVTTEPAPKDADNAEQINFDADIFLTVQTMSETLRSFLHTH
ncbi:Recombination-associated protein RdgC [Vibrio thalassae]|uniref:Recombination-associated protein RdgC n=1 Tax=Vibrio thalassae TaxID=1243014 RepID=A0A240EIE6_9VIBR|nr:recombination-associated protein RdgC [Vibrio thalassae]SNX47745.1 Recombination-associated protein RdgC [Vibrio thalassae]